MSVLAVIPARLGSSRLARKPLARLRGRPLAEWVWRAVCRAQRPARVVLATDSQEVRDAAAAFGAEVLLTDAGHASGSDRVAEVAKRLPEYEVVVNVQGDEPLLDPDALDAAVVALEDDAEAAAATLAHWEDGAEAAREVKPLPRRQMVRCGACGVYVLRDRAVSRGGEQFCSSGCADAS